MLYSYICYVGTLFGTDNVESYQYVYLLPITMERLLESVRNTKGLYIMIFSRLSLPNTLILSTSSQGRYLKPIFMKLGTRQYHANSKTRQS